MVRYEDTGVFFPAQDTGGSRDTQDTGTVPCVSRLARWDTQDVRFGTVPRYRRTVCICVSPRVSRLPPVSLNRLPVHYRARVRDVHTKRATTGKTAARSESTNLT